ncbi:MAG: peptidylprolyl isomerase [Vicinamibacterales bacterium]
MLVASSAHAQLDRRLSVLQAEDRRAPTPLDLTTLRTAARSGASQTARFGLRALGRLERPSVLAEILPGLDHPFPEVRAEAADAVAQAAQGLKTATGPRPAVTSAQAALVAHLANETDATARSVLCESIGRLPYSEKADLERAETTLLAFADKATTDLDRLGVAKGLEAFVRLHREQRAPGPAVGALLRRLAHADSGRSEVELARTARVRRLAMESLLSLGDVDADTVLDTSTDPDAQVRRLAMRAAATSQSARVIARGLTDPEAMVRIEALRSARLADAATACRSAVAATADADARVEVVAIDQLGTCGQEAAAVAYLTGAIADLADADAPRNWQTAAHALGALASAAPDKAERALASFAQAKSWQLRVAAARAAGRLNARAVLDALARDSHDNVVEAAIDAMRTSVAHEADAFYVEALSRDADQVLRAAGRALNGSPSPDIAVPALKAAYARVEMATRPGATDAREAIRAALASLGTQLKPRTATVPPAPLTAADLRALSSPRARFTIRDVGVFDVALFTVEAPATVLRFAQLASSGYYNGLTFHRVVPNGVIQGGSPGANEYSSNAPLMRDEVGRWPHVRGTLGISTRGRDTGDGQIFIDLVDNPRYDHTYTVFAQVLNGMEIVDRLMEGDVIDQIEIVP